MLVTAAAMRLAGKELGSRPGLELGRLGVQLLPAPVQLVLPPIQGGFQGG